MRSRSITKVVFHVWKVMLNDALMTCLHVLSDLLLRLLDLCPKCIASRIK